MVPSGTESTYQGMWFLEGVWWCLGTGSVRGMVLRRHWYWGAARFQLCRLLGGLFPPWLSTVPGLGSCPLFSRMEWLVEGLHCSLQLDRSLSQFFMVGIGVPAEVPVPTVGLTRFPSGTESTYRGTRSLGSVLVVP